ncbi:DUF2868 domain-containing protein [Zoogloea sp.]|uniref:DUF2868 domain-containing protein n=1 Tax=Zoogloea sp. TaxID=49181 RepID=UPI00262AED97|nr:DUF2868 domain-containing protein [Zoogloea sp.]MDD3352606.1 DUF2868 domain-containing protein [Zoogloea sp.]
MNEADARRVILVRALESSPTPGTPWKDSDTAWASRAAAEVVGEDADAERFLARRAQLAVERLGDRDRQFLRLGEGHDWRPWVTSVVVAVAFGLGILMDASGPVRYVNLLAFPLLGLILWNLLIYLLLLAHGLSSPFRQTPRRQGPFARLMARLGGALQEGSGAIDSPSQRFRADWALASARLTGLRVGCTLHLAAASFALGAILALYVRGLVLDFQAGWESTFLDPEQVHQALSMVLGPASLLAEIPIPDAMHLATLRLPESSGENAANWIHLIALTLLLSIVLPRLLLAALAGLAAGHLHRHFPLPLGEAYFQRLQRSFEGRAAHTHLLPYSYTLSPQATLRLHEALQKTFGPQASLGVAPCTRFGDEDKLSADLLPDPPSALTLMLFSLSATPETENHGCFVESIIKRLPAGAPLAVVLEEGAFLSRFASQPERLEERRRAWTRLLEKYPLAVGCLNLETGTADETALALASLLDQQAHLEKSR